MTTPDDGLPRRPRGAERRAAARPTAPRPRRARHAAQPGPLRAAGVAVPPPATPASTQPARRIRPPQPSRPTRSAAPTRPAASTQPAAPTRRRPASFRIPARRTLPAAAVTAVTCLFVAVGSPQTAVAAPTTPEATSASAGMQHFVADGSTGPTAGRDDFSVGRAAAALRVPGGSGPTGGAVRPTVGAIPDAGGFGSRWVVGCAACSSNHQGVDFAAAIGTPVVAALPGRVVSAGVLGGYGNQVLLQHADGTATRYGHLSAIDVRPGQVLGAGERLGAVGNTGVSTGAHLHFEVIVAGTPIDPATWLQARGLL
ncbi:hypothetical protein DEJ04_07380 [Curtobacterium sp. MCLR17_044]|nr:hypothetical protein DEJ04_07380 [Curtobacterium sp. MCLR17_044]